MMDAQSPRLADFAGLTIALAVESAAWTETGLVEEAALDDFVRATLVATAETVELQGDLETEVSVTLSDDATVREANRDWRGKDKATNILSFPLVDLAPGEVPGPLAGDLLVAHETVAREAEAEGKTFAVHFRHLLVHGFLHLLGYDHEAEAEAEEMEAVEIAVLAGFGIADPYGDVPVNYPAPTTGAALLQPDT